MRDLVFWSGIEPGPCALGMQSLNHWITREVLTHSLLSIFVIPDISFYPIPSKSLHWLPLPNLALPASDSLLFLPTSVTFRTHIGTLSTLATSFIMLHFAYRQLLIKPAFLRQKTEGRQVPYSAVRKAGLKSPSLAAVWSDLSQFDLQRSWWIMIAPLLIQWSCYDT